MSDHIDPTSQACIGAFVRGDREEAVSLLKQVQQPNLLKDDKYGAGLVDWAAARGWLEVIKVLVEEYNCDPMCRDNRGDSPLYTASVKGRLEVIKYLIINYNCDPTDNNNELGGTPLHVACYNGHIDVVRYLIEECKCNPMCTRKDGSRTSLHEACASGHLNIVNYLITQCNCDPMCRDNTGDCPLYTASVNGRLEVIKYLIINYNCDPTDNNNELGGTPLHVACYNGHIDVVRYLIEECKCDPMRTRKYGSMTSLHEACAGGQLNIVKYLITQCNCDPMYRDTLLNTPLHAAVFNNHYSITEYLFCTGKVDSFSRDGLYSYASTMRLFNKFSQLKSCTPIDSYINIFLLGNSGVGKTTLTQVIKKRANGVSMFDKYRSVSNVELLTTGIIPHTLEHEELGNVVLHDLAGQPEYYSSHSAVMENVLCGPAAVFVIVIKLSDDPPYKWLNLVKNLSSKCSGICYAVTVASHRDMIKHADRIHCKQSLQNRIEHFLHGENNLRHIGIVSLDCRRLDGKEFSDFNNNLYNACQSVRTDTKMFEHLSSKDLVYCCMLYKFLKSKQENVYKFDSLFKMITGCSDLYLPETQEELQETLDILHQTGLIMIIKCSSGLWIVANKQYLLTEVNGEIFSPFKKKSQHLIASNTGE